MAFSGRTGVIQTKAYSWIVVVQKIWYCNVEVQRPWNWICGCQERVIKWTPENLLSKKVHLEDDQNRRDFTINVCIQPPMKRGFPCTILDPFNGSLPPWTKMIKDSFGTGKTFSDDPLRMIRAIRFSTNWDSGSKMKLLQPLAKQKPIKIFGWKDFRWIGKNNKSLTLQTGFKNCTIRFTFLIFSEMAALSWSWKMA